MAFRSPKKKRITGSAGKGLGLLGLIFAILWLFKGQGQPDLSQRKFTWREQET
jgi:hypothetical protein